LVSFGALMLRPAAAPASAVSAARPTSSLASLAAGMALTLADPKAIVFYLSLLPAFVDLERAGAGAAAAVMLAATLAIALVKGLWVALVLRAGERLRARMTRRGLRLLGAAVLLAVGLLSMLAGAAALLDLPAGLAV
ncbi:MAG: LysE family transporter, partial [Gammaproteobacteria bacterium]